MDKPIRVVNDLASVLYLLGSPYGANEISIPLTPEMKRGLSDIAKYRAFDLSAILRNGGDHSYLLITRPGRGTVVKLGGGTTCNDMCSHSKSMYSATVEYLVGIAKDRKEK